MFNLSKLSLTILSIVIIVILSACGGSARSDDIASAALATGSTATTVVYAPATEAPGETAVLTEPIPTATAAPISAEPTLAPAVTAGPVINFKLSGGIVGFCDELSIDGTGAYILRTCQQQNEITGTLEQVDLDSLTIWVQNLTSFQLNFEDNPGQADNMAAVLVFNGQGSTEAAEAQQRIIYDWVNGLLVRVRPQPVAPPTPEPLVVGPAGLCPDITRPAVLVVDYKRPGGLTLVDPSSKAECDIQLSQPPSGRIATAAGNIYFPIFDQEAKTMTVWQLNPTGEQTPLPFTTVTMVEFGPYSFAVSSNGSKIAWARAVPNFEIDPPLYRNDLWVANTDGSNQVTLLAQLEQESRYVEPVYFSPDQSRLFYALQPDALGGSIFSFSGRYHSMYSLPTTGGEPQLIYACPEDQGIICIGDISPDGRVLAYIQPGQDVVVLGSDGNPISTLTPPATDYIGSPVFGPTGHLAFVSATLSQASEQDLLRPNPGAISFITSPYTGEPQTLLSDNRVMTAWEWLDENRLIYGTMAEDGNIGTGLVTIDGQQLDLSPSPALAVLR